MSPSLADIVKFNTWANHKVVESLGTCPAIPEAALIRLSHLLENNWYVYDIVHERDLAKWDDDRNYTLEECVAEIPRIDSAFTELLQSMTEEQLMRSVQFRNVVGELVERSISDLIFHTFDHCTYHRGQIAIIVRESGGEPARTWFNRWVAETERGTKA
ncbi:MAG: hypothetical protein IPG71_10325 [bacterium]|nr:hypothetical protein [bacterium]